MFTNIVGLFVAGIIAVMFIQVIMSKMKTTVLDVAVSLLGVLYIVGFILFIPLIHGTENGKFLVWYIVLGAWGTDTFAYYIGRKFGKHKLTKVSPNKSVEGSIGGIVGAVILFLCYTIAVNHYTDLALPYVYIGILGVIFSILGQFGDLAASSIKRYLEIKDFGELIPGHGGILDRIDSIIFIAPFAYFLLMILMG